MEASTTPARAPTSSTVRESHDTFVDVGSSRKRARAASDVCGKSWFVYAAPALATFASRWGPVRGIKRSLFNNFMPNIFVSDVEDVMQAPGGANILYFTCYSNLEEKKIEEMIVFCLADTSNVRTLVVVDMYDPSATMERVTVEGTIATANADAHFWKTLPRLESGRKAIRIVYDQHTLQNRFFFTDGNTSVRLYSAIPLFIEHLRTMKCMDVSIVFPDEGAFKRFSKPFAAEGFDLIICGKERKEDGSRVIRISEGNASGKKAFLIDDLVRSGGTLLQCAQRLMEAGVAEMNCFVVHAEFPGDSWTKFLPDNCPVPISSFYVTDSVASTIAKVRNKDPFRVLSLANHLSDVIDTIQ